MEIWQNAVSVISLVFQLFLLMGIGILCSKCGWIDGIGTKQMTNVLLKVVTFCIIVESFLSVEYSKEKVMHLLGAAVAYLICTGVTLVVLLPFFRKTDQEKQPILRYGVLFSNCGFMSLPLVSALLGAEGVFIVSMYVAMFQIATWTLGVKVYGSFDSSKALKQILLNPGVISVLVGLPLFFFHLELPEILTAPMGMLADLNTPMAMIVTGFYLSKMAMKIQKGDGAIIMASVLRLIVIPLMVIGLLYLIGIRGFLLVACTVPICAPSASNTSLFAVIFHKDQVYASRMMSICTLLSIITMPFVIALAQTTM